MSGFEALLIVVGYVALLLWGVRMVRTGVTRSFSGAIRRNIGDGSTSRVRAAAIGAGFTALIQSATAMSLIVSSFVARELLTLPIALAVVLGADVGTCLAAFLFSFDLSWLPPLLLTAGVFGFLGSTSDRVRSLCRIAIGLGLMLLSLKLIGLQTAGLRQSASMTTLMGFVADQTVIAAILAAGVTLAAHSSLAMVVLIASLTASGGLPMPLAIALVIGVNVGGALIPFVDQTGAPPAARRVALGNLLMKTGPALIALVALIPLIVAGLSRLPIHGGLPVLLFHLLFNLAVALGFLPFTGEVARFAKRLLPDQPVIGDRSVPRYLDATLLESPTEALAVATRETLALGDLVAEMLEDTMDVFETDDSRLLKKCEKTDDDVDRLHEHIKLYLVKLSSAGLSPEDSRAYVDILTFVTNLEHIGDIVDKNLMELAAKKIKNHSAFSREGLDELTQFHRRVADNLKLAFNVFTSRDVRLARKLLAEKQLLRDAEAVASKKHYERLRLGRSETLETSAIHLDVIRDLKRINSHLTSVAYPILEQAGELLDSRLRTQLAEAPAEAKPDEAPEQQAQL